MKEGKEKAKPLRLSRQYFPFGIPTPKNSTSSTAANANRSTVSNYRRVNKLTQATEM